MATYPYCLLTHRDGVPTALLGVDEAPVRAIRVDDVVMWVSDAPVSQTATDPAALTLERAHRHDEVVTAALATGTTPLPMRYGQRLDSDDRAREYLVASLPALRSLFARVSGMVEMSVVIAPAFKKTLRELEPISPAGLDAAARGAGLTYLRHLREQAARDERARSSIDAQLDRVSAAVRALAREEERHSTRRGVGAVAHLIARESADRYRELVRALSSVPEWQILVSGPRAPYSFCAIDRVGGSGGTFLAT